MESKKEHIKTMANNIREKLRAKGIITIFGEPVDFSDSDSVLVAAVHLAEIEERQKVKHDYELLITLGDKALNTTK